MEPTLYLLFDGQCLEALRLYAATLDGEILTVMHPSDVPADAPPGGADCGPPPPEHFVIHASMRLGQGMLMASDCPPGTYLPPQGFSVSIAPPTRAEFDRIWAALSEGARAVPMPPGETFFAERFAMFTDRFGTPWMLVHTGARAPAAGAPPA